MRLSSVLLLALAAEATVASSWFSKAAYNKWHETELERWLSDHDIPYPSPADRKDLENIVKDNWNAKVGSPYADWDASQLQAYLKEKGVEAKKGTESSKDSLVDQVKSNWYETEEQADSAWGSVKDWIFDSWTDSQLKSFLDYHGIPNPSPRKRDALLSTARSNYQTVANKVNEGGAYPGNWLYETWSESDLKAWLDERGIPAPQPTTRDKLIASVRRNSRLASSKFQETTDAAASSAAAAKDAANEKLWSSWSDSKLKEFLDKNGVKVPQGSNKNELLALARKHKAQLTGDSVSGSAASAYGAATSKAGNQYAKATDDAQLKYEEAFDAATGAWSESRLKAYLDARGVPVPQTSKKDELLKQVRLHKHKAASGYTAWTFDTWTTDNLRKWLESQTGKGKKTATDYSKSSRDELVKQAQAAYASSSSAGGQAYASVTSALASATDYAKDTSFDNWSDSELKSYLDSYGIPVYQGTKTNELKALVKRQATYFRYGTGSPTETILEKLRLSAQYVLDTAKGYVGLGQKQAAYSGQRGYDAVKEGATYAKNRAYEEGQKASDKVKEEL